MKKLFSIITAIIFGSHAHAADKWPMFERVDVVTLQGKEIPDAYKRTTVTDEKGRTIKGEWLEINRASKTVKFKRENGEEFAIPFAKLSEPDRRYAELETGKIWDIGDPVPVPLDLIIPDPGTKVRINVPPKHVILPEEYKTISTEVINEITLRITFKGGDPDPFAINGDLTRELPLNMLTDKDRATLKELTEKEFPVFPRPALSKENYRYWTHEEVVDENEGSYKSLSYRFGKPMPRFDPTESRINDSGIARQGTARQKAIFDIAFLKMAESYSPQEIYDHLRVRTLTSAFIHEYDDHWRGNYWRNIPNHERNNNTDKNPKTGILAKSLGMLPATEPVAEQVSLKGKISKLGIRLFEEKAPQDSRGIPLDGMLQIYHFIAQYKNMSAGKPKVALATLLANSTNVRNEYQLDGIEKTHGVEFWSVYALNLDSRLTKQFEFDNFLQLKHIRNQLRNNIPVFVYMADMPEGGALLTGFTIAPGKEITYEAIIIECPLSVFQTKDGTKPHKIRDESGIPESKIRLGVYHKFLK